MPNWTLNVMEIHEDDLPLIVNADGEVDLGLVRPMPGDIIVNDWTPLIAETAEAIARGERTTFPSGAICYTKADSTEVCIENPTIDDWRGYGRLLLSNEELYGASNWFDWAISERGWGPKWQPRETEISEPDNDGMVIVRFETAWTQPLPSLMKELADKCQHPIKLEASYEGETRVKDIDGNVLVDDDMLDAYGPEDNPFERWPEFFLVWCSYEDENGEEQRIEFYPEISEAELAPFRRAMEDDRPNWYEAV